jgi:hypothetical protein
VLLQKSINVLRLSMRGFLLSIRCADATWPHRIHIDKKLPAAQHMMILGCAVLVGVIKTVRTARQERAIDRVERDVDSFCACEIF